ncbi:epithelial sodium channel subunit alpha-like [Antedon mediterranea]|uniref:epithelial sodium channel subunit alpha-like n=1 Tax=Antedon mediterranea TaxID=105859 RepID=UPI003AF6DCB2
MADSPSSKQPNETLKEIIEDFGNNTTAHGIPRIITATSLLPKLFWTVLCLVAFSFFAYQSIEILEEYRSYPTTTKLELIPKSKVSFPSVTICNMNRLRRSALTGTRFEELVDIDGGFDKDYNDWFASDVFADSSYESQSVDAESQQPLNYSTTSSSLLDNGTEPTFPSSNGASDNGGGDYGGPSGGGLSGGGPSGGGNDYGGPSGGGNDYGGPSGGDGGGFGGGGDYNGDSSSSSYYSWYDFNFFQSLNFVYDDYYNWGNIENPNDWRAIYDNSVSQDYSDVVKALNPTKEELRDHGHQARDFILQCTFDKRMCNYTDFLQFQNLEFGNCYTFNHGTDEVLRHTSQTGAQFGLHLTLLIEQPEYVGILSHDVGARVSVHAPNIAPHPEDTGIAIETGTSTSIGLRQNEITRLNGNYGNCSDEQDKNEEEGMYYYDYSYPSCKKFCLQNELEENCGCVSDIYIDAPKCDFLNKTQQKCQQLIETLATEDKLDCNCPLRCTEVSYYTSISTSLWPSERYQDHLYSRVKDENTKVSNILDSFEKTRKNLLRVKIFFEELNFQSINEVPIYSTASLLGSLGGLLGLYIGLSTITMVEIIILFIDIIRFTCRKMFCRNRVMAFQN